MDLAAALGLGDRELVSFVGAGGKKTSMARLAAQGRGRLHVGYTTTTHMPPPPGLSLVVDGPAGIESAVRSAVTIDDPIAFASREVENPSRVDVKVKGFDPAAIDALYDADVLDWILVKADGARMREFKAPDVDEPAVPAESTVVVPVVSAKAFDAVLTEETVHRPERVATIGSSTIGDIITPALVGTVLASESGGLKQVPDGARVVPLINKADGNEERRQAREALAAAFDRTDRFETGLITSFEADTLDVLTAD